MPTLAVQILRFVDEHQPGFVECCLVDAHGEQHLFVEKVPVVTTEPLRNTSAYPRPGVISCEVESEWKDQEGRVLVRINTARPWGVESTAGEARFVVLVSQLQP